MRRRGRGRFAAVALAAALLVVSLGWAQPQPTTAAFTDDEHATAYLEALELAAPANRQPCDLDPGFLGLSPDLSLYWDLPDLDPSLDVPDDVEFGRALGGLLLPITGGLLSDVETTQEGPNQYTTTFSGGLLGGLLGGSMALGVRIVHPSGWVSPWLRADASMSAIGANPQCATSIEDSDEP
ncbi:MAG TPA: hypothetical protein VK063_08990 [Beutenbergiaceae bacterium]|nr:hypothetical protein [Beutenbergiaceae bacterium]